MGRIRPGQSTLYKLQRHVFKIHLESFCKRLELRDFNEKGLSYPFAEIIYVLVLRTAPCCLGYGCSTDSTVMSWAVARLSADRAGSGKRVNESRIMARG